MGILRVGATADRLGPVRPELGLDLPPGDIVVLSRFEELVVGEEGAWRLQTQHVTVASSGPEPVLAL